MKKVLVVLSCLLLAVIFRINLYEYNDRINSKYMNLEPARSSEYQSIKISVSLDAPMDKIEKMHHEVMEYAKKNHIAVAIPNTYFKNNKNYYVAYIYAPSDYVYLDKKYCVENKTVNFDNDGYYTTYANDLYAYHLRSFKENVGRVVEYHPMHLFSVSKHNNSGIFYQFAVPSNLKLDTVSKDLTACIENAMGNKIMNTVVNETDEENISVNPLITQTKKYCSYVVLALYMMIVLLYSISKQKEIGVYHLYKNKFRSMFQHVYLPMCLQLFITILSASVFLYVVYIKGIYLLGIEFLLQCLKEFMFYFIFFVFVCVVVSFVFWKMDILSCLKKRLSFSISNYVLSFLKVIMIISFLVPTYQSVNSFKDVYYRMKTVIANKAFYEDSYAILSTYGAQFSNYTQEEEKAYHLLTQKGGVYACYDYLALGEYGDQTHVSVNSNFLNHFPMLDEHGQKIEVPLDENALLIPISKKDEQLEYYGEDIDASSIYYYKDQPVLILDTRMEDYYKYNDGTTLIYVVNKANYNESVSIGYPTFLVMKTDKIQTSKDIVDCLEGNLLSKKMHIEPGIDYAMIAVDQAKDILKYTIIDIVFYIIVLSMFVFLMIYIYFYTEKEELMIRYIHGNKLLTRYGKLFTIQVVVDVITYMICILFVHIDVVFMTILLLSIMLVEFVIDIIFINQMEKYKLINALKGDD